MNEGEIKNWFEEIYNSLPPEQQEEWDKKLDEYNEWHEYMDVA